jgi:hypothetical protein
VQFTTSGLRSNTVVGDNALRSVPDILGTAGGESWDGSPELGGQSNAQELVNAKAMWLISSRPKAKVAGSLSDSDPIDIS